MKIAIIGATGLVGGKTLEILAERDFPVSRLLLVASSRSIGKKISWKDQEIEVIGIEEALASGPDIVFMAAGGGTSKEGGP